MLRFRPQQVSKLYILRERRISGRVSTYNWQTRINWIPAGLTYNRLSIRRRWYQLHYLGSHSPTPIMKKWKNAESLFNRNFLASRGKASVRFLNTYTAHNWL
jgi:hypothetical protein